MPKFGVVYKKSHFSRQSVNCQFNLCLVLRAGQPRLEIRNQEHSWTHFDTINPMAISDLTNEFLLKITFFKVSAIVLIFIKLQ